MDTTQIDAGPFHSLLRAEEASLALRVAIKLNMCDPAPVEGLTVDNFQPAFGLSRQGAEAMLPLLHAMGIYRWENGVYRTTDQAIAAFGRTSAENSSAYFLIGYPPQAVELEAQLKGKGRTGQTLYGSREHRGSLMDGDGAAGNPIAAGLAARAKLFAAMLAGHIARIRGTVSPESRLILVDVGGGSPHVALECLSAIPQIGKAIIADQKPALDFARSILPAPDSRLARLAFEEADFFQDLPTGDIFVLSNVLHDWDEPEVLLILRLVRDRIFENGLLCLHEPLLVEPDQVESGRQRALWMASYGLCLFRLTGGQGRCYSLSEHTEALAKRRFRVLGEPAPTRDGCQAIFAAPAP